MHNPAHGEHRPVLAAATLLALAVVQTATGADIEFRPSAKIASPTIQLKDVATVTGDAATAARLQNIVLAPAPAPGRRMRLEFSTIRSRLEASGISAADINYSGSSVVVVASAEAPAVARPKESHKTKTNVSQPQIHRAEQIMVDAIRRSMRTKNREAAKMFIEAIVEPEDVAHVMAGAREGFEIGPINPRVTDPQTIQIRFQDAQGRPNTFSIQCIASERPQVPVLTRSISTGEVIHESDLTWRPADSTEGILTRIDQIAEKEAKKGLHADEPVHGDDVRSVPLVRSNDIVTGVWRMGGIRISGQFKAKGDGGLGDVITLVKLTGREQVSARVTDVHEAEIVTADSARTANRDDGDDDTNGDPPIRNAVARRSPTERSTRVPRPIVNTAAAEFVGDR